MKPRTQGHPVNVIRTAALTQVFYAKGCASLLQVFSHVPNNLLVSGIFSSLSLCSQGHLQFFNIGNSLPGTPGNIQPLTLPSNQSITCFSLKCPPDLVSIDLCLNQSLQDCCKIMIFLTLLLPSYKSFTAEITKLVLYLLPESAKQTYLMTPVSVTVFWDVTKGI